MSRIRSIKQIFSLGLLALTPALTGCLVHTHSVLKTPPPASVLSSSLSQLLKNVDDRYGTINSINALGVDLNACTGGAAEGEVKCVDFSGFIVVSKPDSINVILKVPLLGSSALDMVSDGKTFTMKLPTKNCVITGSDVVTNPSQKGLYALRPDVILDSLLIRGIQAGQVVSMTQDSRTIPDPKKRKGFIREPDYDIEFLSEPKGQVASTLRVIHTGRIDLLPYRQDIYNTDGKIVTQALYSNYQKFGDINFPAKIEIDRPLDELTLTITLNSKKTTFNQTIQSDTFDIGPIGSDYTTYNMDDPAVAATVPCAAHATQSPR
jgi:hypothetical protein